MAKYLCKLWNADRSTKKAFMCQPSIDLIKEKGIYKYDLYIYNLKNTYKCIY